MTKNSFINMISFCFSFFQIIIYISDCVTANNTINDCPSKTCCNIDVLDSFVMQFYRFVNFASYSNRDMVYLTTSLDEVNARLFYGYKNNGRPLFKDSYYFSFEINNKYKYESESLVIKESGNTTDKEYLMSFSLWNSSVDIYDFENNKTYIKETENFLHNTIESFRNVFLSLKSNGTHYYYLLGFINKNKEYIIQKHLFYSIKNFNHSNTLIKNITINNIKTNINNGSGLSCFQTEKQFIICFFLNQSINYFIKAFYTNLTEIKNFNFYSKNTGVDDPFYKCLHLKDEIGIFTYYNNSFPVLLFKEFNKSYGFQNYTITEIILNKTNNLFNDILLNDIIKFTKNRIYYCATDTTKKNIYIISIYLYNEKYKIRYYIIKLDYYEIYKEMRIHIYKNFLAFAFSYTYYDLILGNKNYYYYNSLLIFNYPNSTDYDLSLFQNLFQISNNSDIYINLWNQSKIENNIFGYKFSVIIISDLVKCNNLNLISSNSKKIIKKNYTLTKNESIKLDINNYTKFSCNIQYSIIAKPDLEYCDGNKETNEELNYTYIGRLTYYNITLNESLTSECEDTNCKLCLIRNNSFCIYCKYNNTFSKNKRTKICLDQVIMIENIEFLKRELRESKQDFVNNIGKVIKSIDIN